MRFLVNQEYSGIKISALIEFFANCEHCKHLQALKTTDVVKNITALKSFEGCKLTWLILGSLLIKMMIINGC